MKTSMQSNLFRNAMTKRHATIIRFLDDNQISLEDKKFTDEYGSSLYHIAVMTRNVELLKSLLRYRSCEQIPNVFGQTPLSLAIEMQDEEMIKAFYGEDTDKLRNEKSVLEARVRSLTRERDDLKSKSTLFEHELKRERLSCKRNRDAYNDSDRQCKRLRLQVDGLKNEIISLDRENKKFKGECETYKRTISNFTKANRK